MADGLTEAGATVLRHGTRATSPQNPAVLLQDLLQPDGPSLLLQAAFAIHPSLNLLVCNAGSFFDVPFLQMDRARYEKTMRLNVESVFFLVQEFARRISEQKREVRWFLSVPPTDSNRRRTRLPTTPPKELWSCLLVALLLP